MNEMRNSGNDSRAQTECERLDGRQAAKRTNGPEEEDRQRELAGGLRKRARTHTHTHTHTFYILVLYI